MLVKLSPLITAASGSIGTLTLRSTASGTVAAQRPRHTQSASTARAKAQRALQLCNSTWRDLTDSARLNWYATAARLQSTNRLGTPISLTAKNLFTQFLFPQALEGQIINTGAPEDLRNEPIDLHSLTFSAGGTYMIRFADTAPVRLVTIHGARSCSTTAWKYTRWHYLKSDIIPISTPKNTNVRAEWLNTMGELNTDELFKLRLSQVDAPIGYPSNLYSHPQVFEDAAI